MCLKNIPFRGTQTAVVECSVTGASRITKKQTCFRQETSTLKPSVHPWKNSICSYLLLQKACPKATLKAGDFWVNRKQCKLTWANDNFPLWEIRNSQNNFVKIFMSAIIYMNLSFGFWITELISGSQTTDLSFPSADNVVLPRKSSCALNLGWNFLQLLLIL